MKLDLTHHASERMGQRQIPASDVELIMLIGSGVSDGYLVRSKDSEAVERRLLGLVTRIRRLRGKRVVMGGGRVITAYRAEQRVKRKLLRKAADRDLEISP